MTPGTTISASEARGFKPDDVEEPIDRWWHRPLADRLVVRPLVKTRVTPNQLTLASGIASLASGMAIGWAGSDARLVLVGAALLFASILLDCADGQLARRRGTSSMVGRILDGAVDAVAPTAVLAGMAMFLGARGFEGWPWPLALITGASLGWHASLYDACKSIHLAGSRPDFAAGGDPLTSEEALRGAAEDHRRRGEWLMAVLLRVFALWTRAQARRLAPWRGRRPTSSEERERFVAAFQKPMRGARWLGFGTHLFVLTLAALGAAISPFAILAGWLVIAGPLNLWGVLVSLGWRRAELGYLAAG